MAQIAGGAELTKVTGARMLISNHLIASEKLSAPGQVL